MKYTPPMINKWPSKGKEKYPSEVIVQLSGGVGNQLFQYAAAYKIALEYGAQLKFERRLYFKFRKKYERDFQLDVIGLDYQDATRFDLALFALFRFLRRIHLQFLLQPLSRYVQFLNFDFTFARDYLSRGIPKRYFLSGYFQDPRFFNNCNQEILEQIKLEKPKDLRYSHIREISKSRDLVAICHRQYEETTNPNDYSRGPLKTVDNYQKAINYISNRIDNPQFLFFSSERNPFLEKLHLEGDVLFIDPQNGYTSTSDSLWLMSHCKHFVFNNSTFYWWGAFLSRKHYEPREQIVFAPDNFLNSDLNLPEWNVF